MYGKRLLASPNPNPPATGSLTAPRPVVVDTFTYSRGGKYLVRFTLVTPGYEPGQFCSKVYTDTITVDTAVQAFVNDTFVCKGSSIPLTARAKWGKNTYTYRWFRNRSRLTLVPSPSQRLEL